MIEYKVRPVIRYIVTKFESETGPDGSGACSSSVVGEFQSREAADDVRVALDLLANVT